MRRMATALAALACAASAPALAEPNVGSGSEAGDQEVVVTGERLAGKKLHQEAAEFVRRIGFATGHRPAARWADAVCPAAYGLAPQHAAIVEAKLRQVAAEAGIEHQRPGCKPNLAVVFVEDGSAQAREMARRLPSLFEEVGPVAKERLFKGDSPIRWWYSTQELGTDGRRPTSDSPYGSNGRTKTFSKFHSSIVSTEVIRAIHCAVVVVDVNRTAGRTLDTVSAYSALVAFAEISPREPPPDRSILDLFETAPGPTRDLTEWDMTFLKALYRMPLDREARMHRGLLTQALVRKKGG
ncbi:MAG: hypothetical protein E6G94_01050 [Alphaproteobacteria bacterium]|nr:MAG: hypothetical protein E6G94_01050 [Alphaproteobacteria bacterium]